MTTTESISNASKHFRLERLADGVYAAIENEGYGAFSNGGFVDLGDRTLVFDSFLTPQAARDLRQAAEQLTQSPITYLINSHWHGDHVRGNQEFRDTTIISTSKTRDLMAANTLPSIAEQKAGLDEYIASLRAELEAAEEEADRRFLQVQLSQVEEIQASLPTLEVTLPTQTFEDQLVFHGTKRRAELRCYGGGHSPSDSFLYLPDDGIAFMADLLFVDGHLAVWEDAREWHRILGLVQELPIHTLVPGHGPVGTQEQLAFNQRYLQALLETVNTARAQGLSEAEVAALPIPAEFAHLNAGELWSSNLKVQFQK
jgi:glyoxylase-like metal-dependent hydrolase (beta-lactamase superfamily II)